MKILNLWMVALMALSFSFTFVSCSDDNDDTDNTEQAKAIVALTKVILLAKAECSLII